MFVMIIVQIPDICLDTIRHFLADRMKKFDHDQSSVFKLNLIENISGVCGVRIIDDRQSSAVSGKGLLLDRVL